MDDDCPMCNPEVYCPKCMPKPEDRPCPSCGASGIEAEICSECEFGYESNPANDSYNEIAEARMAKVLRERSK